MPSPLVFTAGVFQDFSFTAGQAVAAVLLDLFEDFVHGRLGLIRRFRIMNPELWFGLQALLHRTARKQPFESHS